MNIKTFLKFGTPELLLKAIIRAREEMEEKQQFGLKPNSDRWGYDFSHFRPTLVGYVRKIWADLTGQQPFEFPFNDDRVIHMWVSTRKDSYTLNRLEDDARDANLGNLFDE